MSLILRSSSGQRFQAVGLECEMRLGALESTMQLHMSDGVLKLPTCTMGLGAVYLMSRLSG